ncbi:MAG: DUF309 domain-containing protein [Acidobacteriota bacterium]
MADTFQHHFHEGVDHFNRREFWEAHESWEELWLESRTELHQFLQGLIQLAAAYHHVKRGTFSGAVRLFDAAARKLGDFPPIFCGIDRTDAMAAAAVHHDWIATRIGSEERLEADAFPTLKLLPAQVSSMPNDEW